METNRMENPRIEDGRIYYTCTGRGTKLTLCYEYKDGKVGKFIATGSFWFARVFSYLFGTMLLVLCISQAMDYNINYSGLIFGLFFAVLFLGFCPLMRILGKKRMEVVIKKQVSKRRNIFGNLFFHCKVLLLES